MLLIFQQSAKMKSPLSTNGVTIVVTRKKISIKKPHSVNYTAKVELQGVEPWSKHILQKLSTCLFWN